MNIETKHSVDIETKRRQACVASNLKRYVCLFVCLMGFALNLLVIVIKFGGHHRGEFELSERSQLVPSVSTVFAYKN